MTLYELAREMLEVTNPYDKGIDELHYRTHDGEYNLWNLVQRKIENLPNQGARAERCYKSIASALNEYAHSFPAPYSYRKRMRNKFYEWLEVIKASYGITTEVDIPELFIDQKKDDTVVSLVKALQNRDGVSRHVLAKSLGITDRAISKDLNKLNGGASEPFRLGGQPVQVKISQKHRENDKNAYWITHNSLHPIILQENLLQTGILIQALANNYYEHESQVSLCIAFDIWNQLTDYARERIESVFAKEDINLKDFIGILKDECPTESIAGFETEKEMICRLDGEMDEATLAIYYEKVPGRKA